MQAPPDTYQGDTWIGQGDTPGTCIEWFWSPNSPVINISATNETRAVTTMGAYAIGFDTDCPGPSGTRTNSNGTQNGTGDGSNQSGNQVQGGGTEQGTGDTGGNRNALIYGLPGFAWLGNFFGNGVLDLGLENFKPFQDIQNWMDSHFGTGQYNGPPIKTWLKYIVIAFAVIVVIKILADRKK